MIVGGSTARPESIGDLLGPELMGKLDRVDVLSRKVFAGKLPGERRSKRRGQSVEFDDFRSYVPGDDLRHVDWNLLARLDKLYVKLFREEEDLSLVVLLDRSASMDAGQPNKLVFASRLAMALGYVGLVNNNRVSLAAFGADESGPALHQLTPTRGRTGVSRLAAFLLGGFTRGEHAGSGARTQRLRPTGGGGAGLLQAATSALVRTNLGKGVLVVLSDFLGEDDLARTLNNVGGGRSGFDSYCLQIVAPTELEPDKEADLVGDLRLTDVESGRAAEVTISAPLIRNYKKRFGAFTEDLNKQCAARDIAHSLIRTDADIDDLLLNSLRRRGLLG